ncbi:MAG: tetratricopeptide repeat protein [Elusimicrobia bacterium]|nr:tetratricopeptide repeat protein [Elusimicrobiota bacterium]
MRFFKTLILFLFISHDFSFAVPSEPVRETFFDRLMKNQADTELIKGASLMERGLYRQAAVEFAKSCDKNPSAAAYSMYGASLYWLGDIDGALRQYEKALQKDPNSAPAYQLKGIALARKGDTEGALENFLKTLSLDPSRADANMNAGSVYFSGGLMASALSYMKKALKLDPFNPLYLHQTGLIYFYLERYSEAADFFDKAARKSFDYQEPILWLGLSSERMGEEKEALKNYLKAVSMAPGDFFARYKAAYILLKQKKEKEAVFQIKQSLRIRPYEKGEGLSLFVSYGGNQNKSVSETQTVEKFSNPTLDQIYKNLIKAPASDKLFFSLDIISSPKTVLKKKEESFKNNLSQKDPKRRYSGRSAQLDPSSEKEREKAVYEVLSSLEKETLLGDSSYDHKINFYMSSSPSKSSSDIKAVYSPREIKNTMGLWVYGNNWVDVLAEENESGRNCAQIHACMLLNGLAYLLIGEADKSQEFFLKAFDKYPVESVLGRAAAYVSQGREDEAVSILTEGKKLFPKDKIIEENLSWLKK